MESLQSLNHPAFMCATNQSLLGYVIYAHERVAYFLYKELTLSSENESGLRCQASLVALLDLCTRSLFFGAVPVSYPEFSVLIGYFRGVHCNKTKNL